MQNVMEKGPNSPVIQKDQEGKVHLRYTPRMPTLDSHSSLSLSFMIGLLPWCDLTPSIEIRSAFPGDLGKKEDEEEEKILLIAQTEVSLSQQSYCLKVMVLIFMVVREEIYSSLSGINDLFGISEVFLQAPVKL